MKDKRLEVKLSVRGDGSLGRNSTRSSIRSNRSNISSSGGLPVSEIFANDRFTNIPHNTPFDVNDKYRRRPIQQGYPAQSLQVLNNYEQQRPYDYDRRDRSNPYIDYGEPSRHMPQPQYYSAFEDLRYRPMYQAPPGYVYSTLPRTPIYEHEQHRGAPNFGHNTLPARSSLRRVRISTQRPIVYGYDRKSIGYGIRGGCLGGWITNNG
ncbi:uncharacterized protein LOC114357675 [Ostrinia furnacalis]|uniref:uncharacterized protein LOC114357675 n=1 Tax=Ostrinia furnacalis TaxID=93504 RepID=UPI001038C865|nr:uncharacterized protein LOC114357675 [Ostrinia furnacalis]